MIVMKNKNQTNIVSLREVYKDLFPIGAAISEDGIERYGDLLKSHFNSITPENALKMINVSPKENEYNFEALDKIVNFAKKNSMLIRGHVLIWHDQVPEWVFKGTDGSSVPRELLLDRMNEYIAQVVGRYKNDIYCWDVVNEAIDDSDNVFYRDTKWFSMIGEDYIEKAFLYAHAVAPEAVLFYNDYNYVLKSKREKIYKLVKSMKEREIPIHGIGIQGHWGIHYPEVSDIRRTIELFADLGLKIQLTEMDMSMYEWGNNRSDLKKPTEDMLKLQTEKYDKIFGVLREYSDIISGVTFWGVADDYTWLDDFPVKGRKDWPLLFDEHFHLKPAFDSITSFKKREV